MMIPVEDEHKDAYGLVGAYVGTGYFSPALGDGNTYEFDMCEKCLAELFKTFKHDPLTDSEWW